VGAHVAAYNVGGIEEVTATGVRAGRLRADTGLIVRMILALALLGVVYAIFLWILATVGVPALTLVVIAVGLLAVQYYASDRLVLMAMGARIVSEREAPDLHAMVSRVAVLADIPKPKVAVSASAVPNAFATGRNPSHAVVCVTRGILDRLTDAELEAVLAHEVTHVKNRDMMVITFISFFATAASMIFQNGFWLMGGFGGGFGGGGRRRNGGDNMVLVWLVSLAVWVVSFFLIRAVSRYREYAADRGSGILTGRPSDLMSALVKISDTNRRIPDRDLRQVEALSAFFIVPALSRDSLQELLSTHPSLEHRLSRLRTLEDQLR
jgi:heat shock protein HtpX